MISVQTNVTSMMSCNFLYGNRNIVKTLSERLTTGLRINRGADDPSGLAISQGMKAHYHGLSTALENMQDFLTYLEARDRSMQEQMECAIKVRDLCVRAANDATLTSADLQRLDTDAKGLADVVDHIGKTATLRDTVEPGSGVATLFGPGEVDVLWVLDQTGSMDDHLGKLASVGASQMFNELTGRKFDVRMAAVGFGEEYDIANHDTDGDGPDAGSGLSYGNALTFCGVFQDNAADFAADVTTIKDQDPYGLERGLSAIWQAADQFSLAPSDTAAPTDFRESAQKIVILITDEDSDDAGYEEPTDAAPEGFSSYVIPTSYKTSVVSKLQTKFGSDIQVWTAANLEMANAPDLIHDYPPHTGELETDDDYLDVVTATGGQSVDLDTDPNGYLEGGNPGTTWITSITSSLAALGGPYELMVQYGPEAANNEAFELKTVTAATTGLNVTLTSASSARTGIDTATRGINFIANEMEVTGHLQEVFRHMINDYSAELINCKGAHSRITDADMAELASEMAKQQIVLNSAESMAAQANAEPAAAMTILHELGVGRGNELLDTNARKAV